MQRKYVYRYNEINGQPAWQWRLKNTHGWFTCATENESLGRMMADAVKHRATADIEDISVVRPREHRDKRLEHGMAE